MNIISAGHHLLYGERAEPLWHEGLWVYDLGIVEIASDKAMQLFQAYSIADGYDHLHFLGWIQNSDGSTQGPFLLESIRGVNTDEGPQEGWYQVPHKPAKLTDEYVVHATSFDDLTSNRLRGTRVRLLRTDGSSVWKTDHVDLDMNSHYSSETRVIRITDNLFVVAIDSESRAHLVKRDGDALTAVDVISWDTGEYHFPICFIVRGMELLITWGENNWFTSDPSYPPATTRVIPVTYAITNSSITVTNVYGPMGNFRPTTFSNWEGFHVDDIYDFIGAAQVGPNTAAWGFTQTNYPDLYPDRDNSYESFTSTAMVTWDGNDVHVSEQLDSATMSATGLYQQSVVDIVPTGNGNYAVISHVPFEIIESPGAATYQRRGLLMYEVQSGAIVNEQLIASTTSEIADIIGLGTYEIYEMLSLQAAGESGNIWVLMQGWVVDEPYLGFFLGQFGSVPPLRLAQRDDAIEFGSPRVNNIGATSRQGNEKRIYPGGNAYY